MAPRDLSAGMSGADVQAIQQALNVQPNLPGPPLQVNGVYDAATAARVVAYQRLKKLPQTGLVDAATRLALYPYGVATITILGARLSLPDLAAPAVSSRIPNFSTYQLTPPSWAAPRLGTSWAPLPKLRWGPRADPLADWRDHVGWSDPTRLSLDWMRFSYRFQQDLAEDPSKPCINQVRLPNANVTLPVQDSFDIAPFEPATMVRGGPFSILGFTYNHTEIVPGGQSTFPYGGNRPGFSFSNRQDAVTLTMQMVYQRGPDDGHNQTLTGGVQVGAPIVADFPNGGPWTFNPFIQFTDVDLIGNFGLVHLWQPYAQLGLQFQGPGDPHPTINGGLFPINLGFDIGKRLTLQATAGVPFAYDFQTRTASWGLQGGFGIALKLGDVSPVVKWGQQ
jgi:hypothetical protein